MFDILVLLRSSGAREKLSSHNSFENNTYQQLLAWICWEWKVLPTEERFKKLTMDQIRWLREGYSFLNTPPEEPMGLTGDPDLDSMILASQGKTIVNTEAVDKVKKMFDELENGNDIEDWEDITNSLLNPEVNALPQEEVGNQ